jgi:hypothetical protein
MKAIRTTMQMEDEIRLHEKGWIVQRVGWVILAILLVAAILGVFGDGILSNRTQTNGNVSISYQRFGRFESQQSLKINATSVQRELIVSIPQGYLRAMEIDNIIPEPAKQKIENDHLKLSFDAEELAEVTVYFNPKQIGTTSASVKIDDQSFLLSHFIYP